MPEEDNSNLDTILSRDEITSYDGSEPDPEIPMDDEGEGTDENAPFTFDEELPNLIEAFEAHPEGLKALKDITAYACESFDADWESTEKHRSRVARDWKLFSGDLPPKSYPFEHAANPHMPIMLENIVRIYFRSFDELFSDWSNVFNVLPVTPEDQPVADILSTHGNWQIREQLTDFYRQMQRGMLQYFSSGDVVYHSFYDNQRCQNSHDCLTSDDFVIPFSHVTTRPDYSDVPHRTKIMHKYRHQLQAMRDIWHNIDEVIDREPSDWDSEPEAKFRDTLAKTQGIEIPTTSKSGAYKLLQWEGWTDCIPNQPRDRFVQIIVDYDTRRPLCLTIHEEANWQEKRRFDTQAAELDAYRQACLAHELQKTQLLTQQTQILHNVESAPQMGIPIPHPDEVQSMLDQVNPDNLQKPVPPAWCGPDHYDENGQLLDDAAPEPPRKEAIHMFTHGVCVEPMAGNLGLGFGHIQADLNRAANTALAQFTDSATQANAWSLILAPHMEFDRPFSFGPGSVNKLKNLQGNIADGIFELKPQPANPQLTDLVDRMREYAQSSAQAPEVLSGAPGKSGETFRGIQTRVEQATKQLTVPTRTFAITVLTPILKNNARLNSVFLPDEELVNVNIPQLRQVQQLKITRALYERDYRTQIVGDLQFTGREQKISDADELTQLPKVVPQLANNAAFIYATLRKSLEARGRFDLVQLLGPQPPAPTTPMMTPQPAPPAQPAPGQPQPGQPAPQARPQVLPGGNRR